MQSTDGEYISNSEELTISEMLMLMIVGIGPFLLLKTFIFTNLWLWFIAPLGVPTIPLGQGAGLLIIAEWLKLRVKADSKLPSKKECWRQLGVYFFYSFLTLFVGYVIHQFI